MIPVLRSLDSLLNRFDELSERHASLVSNFDTNFADIENPLHNVARDEAEQQKTTQNLLTSMVEDNDQLGSFGSLDDFNRRMIKSRCHHRPPSYGSNDSSSFFQRLPSRSSWQTTESAPPPHTSTTATIQATIRSSTSQPVKSSSMNDLIEPKSRVTTKTKPNVLSQNPSTIRRDARNAITTFTMETIIRLSRPRACHQSPIQKVSPKRVHRRPRPIQNIKKEALQPSKTSFPLNPPPPPLRKPPPLIRKPPPSLRQPSPPPPPPQIKRTNPTRIKSSPKKLKADDRFITENSKRIPMSNFPRPALFLAPPPTICLTFPMQPELKSSRVVVIPKPKPPTPVLTKRTISIFTNKRSIIPPNRMIYLMT